MNEHLFKLKKDGKTVGYLKLAEGWTQFHSPKFAEGQWYYPCTFKWETAYPFVTKDKNGKDVFAEDKISFVLAEGFGVTAHYTGTVYYCKARLAFCVNAKPAWDVRIKHNCSDIELIEKKEDEEHNT